MIAGIAIPDSSLAREATGFLQDALAPLFFDHSRRCPPRGRSRESGSACTKPQGSTSDTLAETAPGYVRPGFCDFIRDSRFEH
jgi:hypothetical protein